MEIRLKNLKDTEEFGIKLGKLLKAGHIVCLNGDLGAGKTTLTKSIGIGLDVDEYITSPSFTLINQYRGRMMVYHFDVYRLEDVDELYDLGFDEYFFGDGVSIIEWAERIEKFIPEDRIVIEIKKTDDVDERILHISGYGKGYEELIKELKVD